MNLPLPLGVRNSFPALAAALAAATVLSAQAQPELVSVVPDRFAIAVSPGAQVILIFSVPMNTNATAAQFTNFSSASPVSLPATQEWADGDTVLICTPDQTNAGIVSVTFTNASSSANQFFRLHKP